MSVSFRFCRFAFVLALGIFCMTPSVRAQFGPPPPPPHAPHPTPTPDTIAQGKTLFEGTCSVCHGIDGSGANGPNIREAAANLGPEGLYSTVYSGVPASGMPSFSTLGEQKIWLLVNYVSSLGHEATGVVTGNPTNGKQVYESSGCSKCHIINGEGGDLGPDLTRITSLRTSALLHEIIFDPGAHLPPTDPSLQERSAYPAYVVYKAVMKDGKAIEGMRIDEDSFSIQLRTADGSIRSVSKMALQKLEAESGKSFMPSYKGKLTDSQLDDLVAYLSSLGGAQ